MGNPGPKFSRLRKVRTNRPAPNSSTRDKGNLCARAANRRQETKDQ